MKGKFTFGSESFPWPLESEWEGEADRTGRDYIRWAQTSLNLILGTRLAVDGVIGPQTRSSICAFQRHKSLSD